MVNRGDLRHTSEYKSWVKDQKSYDAVYIPFLIFGLAVVCFFYIWLYENCDFVSSLILVCFGIVVGVIYYIIRMLRSYRVCEFTFVKKKVFPYHIDDSPKFMLKDSSGKWYSSELQTWARLPVGVPVLLIYSGGKVYDFLYVDPVYNPVPIRDISFDNQNLTINSSFDGLAWEQSTLKVLRERIYSNEFYDKVLLDYKSNPADYK